MAIEGFRRSEALAPIFTARSEVEDGSTRVLLYGELDVATVPLLVQEVERVEQHGGPVDAFDLGGLTFIAVAGIRAVLSAEARARNDGRGLAVIGAGQDVRRVFELTGNEGLFDVDSFPPAAAMNGASSG